MARPKVIDDGSLLDAALRAFADLGYEGASLRAMAREIGVSHNTINQRYGTKERLWYAAVDHSFSGVIAAIAEASLAELAENGDKLAFAKDVTKAFALQVAANPAVMRVLMYEAATPGPRFEHIFENYLAPIQRLSAVVVEELQVEGRVRPGPIGASYFFLTAIGIGSISGLTELLRRFNPDGDDVADIANLAIDVVFDGLTRRGRDKPRATRRR